MRFETGGWGTYCRVWGRHCWRLMPASDTVGLGRRVESGGGGVWGVGGWELESDLQGLGSTV